MTRLREKMIKAMELRNLAHNTQRYYLSAVGGLSRYYQQSPDQITKEMIEDYLLHLKNDKGNTPGSCATVVSGVRFFYNHVADTPVSFTYRFSNRRSKLPTVLTHEEVWNIIDAPRSLKHRMVLMTTYSAGLLAGEVAALKPENIDSKSMLIKVEKGKGGKQRYTILASILLEAGYDIRRIQVLMGHRRLSTTMIYLHVSRKTLSKIPSPLDLFDPKLTGKEDDTDDPNH